MKEIIYTLPPNGDQDQGHRYLAAAWSFVMLALISTIVRIVVRSRLTRNLGWDDFWIVVCMTSNLVGLGFVTREVIDGLGRHMYYLTPSARKNFTIIGWLDWMQTFITIMFCKISICMFLLRIKTTTANKIFMYSLIAANVIVTIVVCGMFIGICSPPDAYWTIGKDGVCFSDERLMAIVISQGLFSALSDIVLATTPLLFLKDLQISQRTKIALCVLMGAGYLTAAASIVRTALSGAILEIDVTYAMIPNAAWRATEVNLGVICANAPILRPLYLWSRGRLQSRKSTKSPVYTPDGTPITPATTNSKSRLWFGARKGKTVNEMTGSEGAVVHVDTGVSVESREMGLPIQGKREGWEELRDDDGSGGGDLEGGTGGREKWMPRTSGRTSLP